MCCLLFVHYDLHCWSSFDLNGTPEVWVLVKHMQWQPKHNSEHSLCPTGETRRGHLVSREFNFRCISSVTAGPPCTEQTFTLQFPFPKVDAREQMYRWWTFTNDKHNTEPFPRATWSARVWSACENSIGEPLVAMLDAWMTAFKRVSVPYRQLGANLIDTHKTLPSCACGNCRHDSLSLSMKTAGFCKRHAFFSMVLLDWRVTPLFCVYLFPCDYFFSQCQTVILL